MSAWSIADVMIDAALQRELLAIMAQLSIEDQVRVLDFARSLVESQQAQRVGDQPEVVDP